MAVKKQKFQDPENIASGYIHTITPIKKSSKGFSYFNAKLQEEDKVTDVVGFKEKMHHELLQFETNRTPIKFSDISRVASYRHPGSFDIKLTNYTKIAPARKLTFTFEKLEPTSSEPEEKTIQQIKRTSEGTKVNTTAKVLRKMETTNQQLKFNRKMLRTDCVVADATGSIELTLWGTPEQLLTGKTYIFSNLSVKVFDRKKLATDISSSFKQTVDLEDIEDDVQEDEERNTEKQDVTIIAANITTDTKCCFCNSLVTINDEIQTVKCTSCNKRYLKKVVNVTTRCTISVITSDGQPEEYIVPEHVLNSYVDVHLKMEDKELFLLTNNTVRITLMSGFRNSLSNLEKQTS